MSIGSSKELHDVRPERALYQQTRISRTNAGLDDGQEVASKINL